MSKGLDRNISLNMWIKDTSNLCFFIHQGHLDIVDLFIKHGAKLEVAGRNGQTLLHLASESGQTNGKLIFYAL